MINFDNCIFENKTEHNSRGPHIPDHPYRNVVIRGSESGKTNALLNSLNNQLDIDN